MHPSGAMEIRFDKPSLKYKSGQWIFLVRPLSSDEVSRDQTDDASQNVPDVSGYQWHPFTISSAPDDPYVSVHIRQVGDWTR